MTDGGVKNHTRDIWSAENKVLAFFLLVACLSKFLFLTDISFWLDEQISIAIAMEGPVGCVPAALRFSSHPPSYYCQLGIWTVLSKSDFWIMANAIFLNMVCCFGAFSNHQKTIWPEYRASLRHCLWHFFRSLPITPPTCECTPGLSSFRYSVGI